MGSVVQALSARKWSRAVYQVPKWLFSCILRRDKYLCLAENPLRLRCYLTSSNRGNPILWDSCQNSYYRIVTRPKQLKSLWKCRQPGCKARVHTNDLTNTIIKMRNEHTHDIIECSTGNISVKEPENKETISDS